MTLFMNRSLALEHRFLEDPIDKENALQVI